MIPGEVIALLIFCHSVKNDNVPFLTQTIVVSFVQMFLFSLSRLLEKVGE